MPQSLLDSLLLQPEFSRKARIPSLYSDFSPLILSNRDGYEANIQAWLSALSSAIYGSSQTSSRLTIDANEQLASALISHQWGKPLALPTIEREARLREAWVPCDVFISRESSIYETKSYLSSLSLGAVLSWTWSKLYTARPATQLSDTRYVLIANVEKLAKAVEMARSKEVGTQYSDGVTTVSQFTRWMAQTLDVSVSPLDVRILLRYLSRDKRFVTVTDSTVKFGTSPVTESDVAVAALKETIALQSQQIETLNKTHADLGKLLKTQLDNKVQALNTLRKRKGVEKRLEETMARQSECSSLLDRIDEGVSQLSMLDGMERASAALGRVLAQIGGVERVENVIDQVREQGDQVAEIGQALATTSLEDEDENVDAEYAALLESTRKSSSKQSTSSKLSEPESMSTDSKHDASTMDDTEELEKEIQEKQEQSEATSIEREAVLA